MYYQVTPRTPLKEFVLKLQRGENVDQPTPMPITKSTTTKSDIKDSSSDRSKTKNLHNLGTTSNNTKPYAKVHEELDALKEIEAEKDKEPLEEDDVTKSTSENIPWIAIALVILIGLIAVYAQTSTANETQELSYSPQELLETRLSELINNERFKDQPKFAFRVLNITISETLFDQEPPSPGVILLLGTRENVEQVQNWMISLIRDMYQENENTINCKNLPKSESEASLNLRTEIEEKSRNHLIIIENVDYLPSSSIATLQPFFDHENAPYKNVVYLLTTVINKKLTPMGSPKAMRELAMNYFDEKWKDYAQEYREAMYSRILSSVTVLSS